MASPFDFGAAPNNGLLLGINEGLKNGLLSFNQEQERGDRKREKDEDRSIKAALAQRQASKDKSDLQEKVAGLLAKGYKDRGDQPLAEGEQALDVGDTHLKFNPRDFPTEREKLDADAVKAKTAADATASNNKFQHGAELRKEYSGLPVSKNTQQVAESYGKVLKAAEAPSAAGDLSLIFAYMKMLDPNSSVREGEFANAQNAAGVPDQILNMYNRAKNGQRLNDNQRQDFVGQAGKVFESQVGNQKNLESQYTQKAQELGLDPRHIITDFSGGLKVPDKAAGLLAAAQNQKAPGLVTQAGLGGPEVDAAAAKRQARIKELRAKLGK